MKHFLITCCALFTAQLSFAQTTFSGGIYANTTWSLAGSPYLVNGNVVVFDNVTLTVDPGVIIKFDDGTGIEIRGTLLANGTVTDTIQFISNNAAPWSGGWSGIKFTTDLNSAISYIKVSHAAAGIDCFASTYTSWSVNNCRFSYCVQGASVNSGEVNNFTSCKFDFNTTGIPFQQYSTITNCSFVSNVTGIAYLYDTYVNNCQFILNTTGINSYRANIQNSTFSYNGTGLEIKLFTQSVVVSNTFTYNATGLKVRGDSQFPNAAVNGNTICGNTLNVENTDYISIDFTNNCWCSDDSTGIAQYMTDGYDNINLGLLWYSPWTTCALGIDDRPDEPSISVYPNPAADVLYFQENASVIRIYDAMGNCVVACQQTNSVNVSGLAVGMYFAEIFDFSGNVSRVKFVKE